MSQSPSGNHAKLNPEDEALDRYQTGWNQLNELLRNGGSLSGRESNCSYLNLGGSSEPRFANVSHVSGFDSLVDGRGLAVSDWDRDGDLDVWMSNRTGPRIRFLRNDTKPPRHFVSFRLQGTRSNRDAIGARVEVEVEPSVGVISRTVFAGDAYISQSSKWLHFGLGDANRITRVRVRWPGTREFHTVSGVEMDGEFQIVEGRVKAIRRELLATSKSIAANQKTATSAAKGGGGAKKEPVARLKTGQNKMVVVGRLPLPPIEVQINGQTPKLLPLSKPMLVLLWAPECPYCLEELSHWSKQVEKTRAAGLELVAISAAISTASPQPTHMTNVKKAIAQTRFPFSWALAQPSSLELIEAYLGFLQQDYQRPLGVPTSLLVDPFGQVAVIYRGAISADEVFEGLSLMNQTPEVLRQNRLPFAGRWLRPFIRPDPTRFASELSERFGTPTAIGYFEQLIKLAGSEPNNSSPYSISSSWKGHACRSLGTILLADGRFKESAIYSQQAHELLPNDFRPISNLGAALMKLGRPQDALAALNKALQLQPDRPSVLINRATIYGQLKRPIDAIQDWETLLRINPDDERSRLAAAALAYAIGDDQRAVVHYTEHVNRHSDSVDAAGALAWILSTSPDDAVRDGKRAIVLATKWSNDSRDRGRNYKALNALAAAEAENGEFGKAVSEIDRAIELATQRGDYRAVSTFRARRDLYLLKKPFRREPPRPVSNRK